MRTTGILPNSALRGIAAPAIMFYRISHTGLLLNLWTRTFHDEVMLHCARIGYKP